MVGPTSSRFNSLHKNEMLDRWGWKPARYTLLLNWAIRIVYQSDLELISVARVHEFRDGDTIYTVFQ